MSFDLALIQDAVEIRAIRAGGPGGQHVNKVASAIHLRFDIRASLLPQAVKQRLLGQNQYRGRTGLIIIKAQRFRSLERNRQDAWQRLLEMIEGSSQPIKPRKKSKPSQRARQRRLDSKTKRGQLKALRRKVRN